MLVARFNLGVVEIAGAQLMGFDYSKTMIRSSLVARSEVFKIEADGIIVQRTRVEYKDHLEPENQKMYFIIKPSPSWK